MVGGEEEASRFRDESINEDYDVQLRLTEADRRVADSITCTVTPDTPLPCESVTLTTNSLRYCAVFGSKI
jgi:hypothetical protein